MLSSAEKEKKQSKKAKVWSPKGYLGLPASTGDGVYSLYWVALFALLGWASITNLNADVIQTEVLGQPLPVVVAATVAFSPVLFAMLLCLVFKDRMSWRWPFQKESIIGSFGLFVLLGVLACQLPVYHATLYLCQGV